MPRIKLAYWHGPYGPGEEVDVTDDEMRALSRDGRVASIVTLAADEAPPPTGDIPPETAAPESRAESGEQTPAREGRRRR